MTFIKERERGTDTCYLFLNCVLFAKYVLINNPLCFLLQTKSKLIDVYIVKVNESQL